MMSHTAANLAAALKLADAGVPIFPALVNEAAGKLSKRPAVSGWQTSSSTDKKQIEEWWRTFPDAVPGIDLGKAHLVVLDLDRHKDGPDGVAAFMDLRGRRHPDSAPLVRTPSSGFHGYYQQPKGEPLGNRTGTLPPGIDVRGAGGWTVSPGAFCAFGKWQDARTPLTTAFRAGTIPALPEWLTSIIRSPRTHLKPAISEAVTTNAISNDAKWKGKREAAYAAAALDNASTDLAHAQPGTRNNSLNTAAFKMATMVAAGWIDKPRVTDTLWAACEQNGLVRDDGADTVQKTLASGVNAGMKEPHENLPDREPDRRTNGGEPPKKQPGSPKRKRESSSPIATASSPHSWDDPDFSILDDRRGELPEFPVDVFIPAWQQWLVRAARGAGVLPEHVALPLLGVASSLIGTARRVRASRSWSEPMTLWACVVAASGDRKTPDLRTITRTLDNIEKNSTAAIAAKRLNHETSVQKSKKAMKKWKEEREAALKADPPKEPPIMPSDAIDPGNFIEPRLYATDPTIERLAALLQARPRGMMLIRDELSGLFANMSRYSGGSDRPFWLEAFMGGRHVVERVSGSLAIEHLLIGVIGCFQPDKLVRAFAGDEDGMYGRFLYAWPLAPEYRALTNEAAEDDPELQNVLTALIRLPSEDGEEVFAPQAIWLSDDAIGEFEGFRQWIDTTKRGLDGLERQWFAKGETVVLRLAGTLAYLAWAIALGAPATNGVDGITGSLEPKTIDQQFIIAAIRLWREFFWPHARAALRQIGLSEKHANARRVLRWIKVHGKTEVSREEVRRTALAHRIDADATELLLAGLVRAGWLRLITTATGGRPSRRWEVNSKLVLESGAESARSAERE
jgi:hypothetical protein